MGQASFLQVHTGNNPIPSSVHEKSGPKGTSTMLLKKMMGKHKNIALKVINTAMLSQDK